MGSLRRLALMAVVALCAATLAPAGTKIPKGTSSDGPTYTNAEVVSVDAAARTLVIKDGKGAEQKVQLDDNIAGFGDIMAGDRVILTLRTGPGWARVSSIRKGGAAPAAKAAPANPPQVLVDDSQTLAARESFATQVANLAGQAERVDNVWNTFRSACNYKAANPHEGARGWFVLWEGSVRADLSIGSCRDLFNQIVNLGEPIKSGMSAAEEVARRTVSPGDIRDIRRRYTMDWDGWALSPPKTLDQ